MTFEDFIGQVQQQSQLPSEADALSVTRAVLVTLAERLKGNEPLDIGSQLPRPLQEFLMEGNAGKGETFPLDTFYHRVHLRAGIDIQQARRDAPIVLAVLRQAISEGEWQDIMSQLPDEYSPLLVAVEQNLIPASQWQQAGGELY